MGTYKPGAFGPFNGRIGDVVASRWKGLNVVKNRPAKSTKPATANQLDQRARFGLVTGFTSKAADLIAIGFRNLDGKVTAGNILAKEMMKSAILGVYPDYELDFPGISLSQDGKLDLGAKLKVQALAEQTVEVSWVSGAMPTKVADVTDGVHILLYNSDKNKIIQSAEGLVRGDNRVTIYVPGSFIGDKVHCYLFFASSKNKEVSPTAYLGVLTVLA
ncbi:DUF6266 family protein [Pedobacter gandavensis]|uniref:DUF6266 family protein n=1 Tax=Pedobacter gandavensis TaxID=2679963 RepID=UPI00292EA67B|nr:DUF6266 family protein [Pedobacter gandavensis]